MNIKRSGSIASIKGPSDWFTGTVRVDAGFVGVAPGRVVGGTVTFKLNRAGFAAGHFG